MTIRKCLAKTIQGRWFKAWCGLCLVALPAAAQSRRPARRPVAVRAKPAPQDLASLVRTLRSSPSDAGRAAVESWAKSHARDISGPLARLALGIVEYEQKDFAAAAADLKQAQGKLPQIADYTAYYLSAARVELKDFEGIAKDLEPARSMPVRSPLANRSWILQARAMQTAQPAEAVKILREHYADLPQPEGDLALADCYQAFNDLPHAVDFYQRIYFQYLTGDAAGRAAAALLTLKDTMGAAYPAPVPAQVLRRVDRLMDAREFAKAREEYLSVVEQLAGTDRDQARVRAGAADLMQGNATAALAYLRGLEMGESEADAERLYYVSESARRLGNDDEMKAAIARLDKQYAKSPWRLRALLAAANRYLLMNRPDDFVPLYRAVYQDFPADLSAGLAHWKVTVQSYLHDKPDAADLLREQIRSYPSHASAGAALYFLGRHAERAQNFGAAKAYYQRLSQTFQNSFYAMLGRDRLQIAPIVTASIPDEAARFTTELRLPEPKPVAAEDGPGTKARIERSRLLRSAGLVDFADGELRYGARTDGQPGRLAMELAGAAETPHEAVRKMKSLAGDYLLLTLEQAPRRFWELLFPMPYRSELESNARQHGIDPYLLAGLIRQESEFNPEAVSRANAYGLTQVRPGTGREYARREGIARFSSNQLFQPAVNLRIGSGILKSMLDRNSGKVEQTLAAYNAGPARAAEWLGWRDYREPAEFIESIPFTETRDYVEAVLLNGDIYRRLYRLDGAPELRRSNYFTASDA
jgi:soluble lytic murein transglycosylase